MNMARQMTQCMHVDRAVPRLRQIALFEIERHAREKLVAAQLAGQSPTDVTSKMSALATAVGSMDRAALEEFNIDAAWDAVP